MINGLYEDRDEWVEDFKRNGFDRIHPLFPLRVECMQEAYNRILCRDCCDEEEVVVEPESFKFFSCRAVNEYLVDELEIKIKEGYDEFFKQSDELLSFLPDLKMVHGSFASAEKQIFNSFGIPTGVIPIANNQYIFGYFDCDALCFVITKPIENGLLTGRLDVYTPRKFVIVDPLGFYEEKDYCSLPKSTV